MSVHFKDFGIAKKILAASQIGQKILDTQVVKDSNIYVPYDTGNLMGSSMRATNFGSGQVAWDTPYAKKLYYGDGMNFSTDKHPQASAFWFEKAKAQNLDNWIKLTQDAIKAGI